MQDQRRITEIAEVDTQGHLSGTSRKAGEDRVSRLMPLWVWGLFGLLSIWGLFSANPLLTVFSISVAAAIIRLLWRIGEPPVLAFLCCYQWLEAVAAIFYHNYLGVTLESTVSGAFIYATWLSLVGVMVGAVGIWVVVVRIDRLIAQQASRDIMTVSVPKAFILYLGSFALLSGLQALSVLLPQLRQPMVALGILKWVAVYVLLSAILEQRRNLPILMFVVLFEAASGLMGFFSGFKSIFIVLAVVLMSSNSGLRPKRLFAVGFVITAVFVLAVVWSAVKAEYRDFLNQGSGQQVALVSIPERIDKLRHLLGNLDDVGFRSGIETLALRVSYVYYFGLTTVYVPENIPYENGKLWLGAIKHIFTPRAFFPDKMAIDDSERTRMYTGENVAGVEQGTSIGIGYMGESYIDFGPVFMFFPVFLLGLFCGWLYRWFITKVEQTVLGIASAATILMFGGFSLAQSNIKLLGGNVMAFVVLGLFLKIFGNRVWQWVRNPTAEIRLC